MRAGIVDVLKVSEEEGLISLNRPSKGKAELILRERRLGSVIEEVLGGEHRILVVQERVPVKAIAAGLHDLVNDGGRAILGGNAAVGNFRFLQRLAKGLIVGAGSVALSLFRRGNQDSVQPDVRSIVSLAVRNKLRSSRIGVLYAISSRLRDSGG